MTFDSNFICIERTELNPHIHHFIKAAENHVHCVDHTPWSAEVFDTIVYAPGVQLACVIRGHIIDKIDEMLDAIGF